MLLSVYLTNISLDVFPFELEVLCFLSSLLFASFPLEGNRRLSWLSWMQQMVRDARGVVAVMPSSTRAPSRHYPGQVCQEDYRTIQDRKDCEEQRD